eukprot:COSAG02_NODE_11164_length_1779_cov_1.875595_2_plen_177_part_01
MLGSLTDLAATAAATADFCALCEVELAAWRCEECTLPFCDGCREETHSKGDSYSSMASDSLSQVAGFLSILAAAHGCLSVGAGNEDTAGHTLSLVGDGSEMMAQMERRAEAQALRASKAEEIAATAAPEPLLSDASVLWISSDDEGAAGEREEPASSSCGWDPAADAEIAERVEVSI